MHVKSFLSAALGACALGLMATTATTAQAAPASGLAGAISPDAARSGLVEIVTWYGRRHCHWHHSYRHCWHRHRHYRPYYGYYRPYYGYGYDRPYSGDYYGYRRWY